MNDRDNDVKELLDLGRLEVGDRRDIQDTQLNAKFMASLHLPFVVGLHPSELFGTVDGFIVEDAVQLKGESQRRDVDVEFAVDGVLAVEVKVKRREKKDELFGEPAFEF
jgi:hypothetical protein